MHGGDGVNAVSNITEFWGESEVLAIFYVTKTLVIMYVHVNMSKASSSCIGYTF